MMIFHSYVSLPEGNERWSRNRFAKRESIRPNKKNIQIKGYKILSYIHTEVAKKLEKKS